MFQPHEVPHQSAEDISEHATEMELQLLRMYKLQGEVKLAIRVRLFGGMRGGIYLRLIPGLCLGDKMKSYAK